MPRTGGRLPLLLDAAQPSTLGCPAKSFFPEKSGLRSRGIGKRGGIAMKCASSLCVALLIGVTGAAIGSGPARAQQGLDLVKQAVAAQGGADALRGLKAVSIKVKGRHWEPGQSYAPGGEPRFLGESDISVTWDLGKDAARNVWDRSMKYPAVEQLKFTEVVMPDLGSVTDPKGTQAMWGIPG